MVMSVDDALAPLRTSDRRIVVLTGAGVSAESGIATFRGREGYWTVGSGEYHPQELASLAAFERVRVSPFLLWKAERP